VDLLIRIGVTPKETVMRFANMGAVVAPAAGLLALACCFAADPRETPASDAGKLVVHEWGTFSTFSGSDGKNLKFNPYDNDLPGFVHGYLQRDSKAGPKGGSISLETPVIYFYPDRPLTVSVRAEFPKGTLTEWYPHAGRTDKKLSWEGVRVVPDDTPSLPEERRRDSRYYAARETDAAPLRVTFRHEDRLVTEHEKFLFYRGVGDFDMPLSVRAQGSGKFQVRWDGKAPATDSILVRVQGGKVRFQPFDLERRSQGGAEAEVRLPDRDSTTEKLGEAVVKRLTARGLMEKEARAMVKTWSAAWFGEDGTRVLYFLPDELTTDLIPLRIEPKPTTLVRVLVGRHDVLTPEQETQIDACVAKLTRSTSDDPDRRAAQEDLAKLGRYQSAAYYAAEARLKTRR
jgi:hypothetical protein